MQVGQVVDPLIHYITIGIVEVEIMNGRWSEEMDALLNWRIHISRNWRILVSKIWINHFYAKTKNWRKAKQGLFGSKYV